MRPSDRPADGACTLIDFYEAWDRLHQAGRTNAVGSWQYELAKAAWRDLGRPCDIEAWIVRHLNANREDYGLDTTGDVQR